MLTGIRNRYLVGAYVTLLVAALVAGCTSREDASEELIVCGNHSCGDLAMVTIDTNGPGGYQYTDVAFSPDGTRIAFSADWAVIPSIPEEEITDLVLSRQILVMPIDLLSAWDDTMFYRNPVPSISALGAELVKSSDFISLFGGIETLIENSDMLTKGNPNWLDDHTLLYWSRFGRRDRLVISDITNLADCEPQPIYYEPSDTLASGFQFTYHHDPALSPNRRWCVFTRFVCDDEPNIEFDEVTCGDEELWVLDMSTIADPLHAVAFPLTSGAAYMEDPAWSPDGRYICFSATTDLVGDNSGTTGELFRVEFDAAAADAGMATLDNSLRRLTTTATAGGDPLVGLHNYAPVYTANGTEIIFVSSRRAPGSTQRGRNLWSIPSDGRLEPALHFFSRYDDVDPTIYWPQNALLFSSRMGFPTEALDAIQRETFEFFTYVYNDTAHIPLTELEIERRAEDERLELELFENKMGHIYLFR